MLTVSQGLAPALALDYARTLARLRENMRDLTLLITESSPNLLAGLDPEQFRALADITAKLVSGTEESLALLRYKAEQRRNRA